MVRSSSRTIGWNSTLISPRSIARRRSLSRPRRSLRLGAHGRLEHLDAVAAMALRVHHGDLRVLQHLFAARARSRLVQHEADRGGEEDLALGEGDRRRDGAADHVGEGDDAVGIALGEQDHGELVAVERGERVLRLEEPPEPAREREQDRVAGREADRVVDLLEAVDVDDEHGRAGPLSSWPASVSAASSRSLKSSRFGRPVRLSCTASCRRRSSAVLASVTSAIVPTMRMTSPSVPTTGRAFRRNQ